MRDVVIVDAVRSPIGKRGGALANVHPVDVLGPVLAGLLQRSDLPSEKVGQVVGGCINKVGSQAMNITRTAWLAYGGSMDVACSTVDSQCGSSQHAVNLAAALVGSGAEDIVIACGVENLSRIPIGADASAGAKAGMGKPVTSSYRNYFDFVRSSRGLSALRPSTALRVTTPTVSAWRHKSAPQLPLRKVGSTIRSSRSTSKSATKAASAPVSACWSPVTKSRVRLRSNVWHS